MPNHRQSARAGTVRDRKLNRSRFQWRRFGRPGRGLQRQRQFLDSGGALSRNLHVMPEMRHRFEHDDPAFRHLDRNAHLFARSEHARIEREVGDQCLEIMIRQVDGGAPEYLPVVVPERQRLRIVRRNFSHARADGEHDFDHFVERELERSAAQRAFVRFLVNVLQRHGDVEHAPAGRAHHIPRQFENAELGRIQEGGDGALLVQALRGCECEDIDAGKIAVGAGFDEPLDGRRGFGIGRLAKCREKGLAIAHGPNLRECSAASQRQRG